MVTLSVIGLGKLGTPMLAVFAGAGYDVIGYDIDPAKRDAVRYGMVPAGIYEPGTQALLDENKKRVKAAPSIANAVTWSDVVFVIVPTPSGPDGGFTLEYLEPVCVEIGEALIGRTRPCTIAIVSTVMPGQTRELCSMIERASGKQHGEGFGLVYTPEFIALGSVVKDLQHPDYVIIGAEDDRARLVAMRIYHTVTHGADMVATSWVNAEIAKIAQNAFITMKITFANQLGNLCQHIPGANVDDVTFALGHDRRIGPRYLKAGTAYGGPCFPRDNRALAQSAADHNCTFLMADQNDIQNKAEGYRLWDAIEFNTIDGASVGILGLAYKPGTNVIEESASINLIAGMAKYHYTVYDPLAMDEARAVLGDRVQYAESVQACIEAADVVVLMHADRDLYPWHDAAVWAHKTVIDPWRILPDVTRLYVGQYIPLGVGPETQEVTA